MKAEKWQKINDLFHSALEVEADKRVAFIVENSNEDSEIFSEVQKLISAHEESDGFIQNPVANEALEIISNENQATIIADGKATNENLSHYKKIGHFEVVQKIGKGGMGEVFLARDESLGRDVAIKILLPEFTVDAERLKRFQLEAKTASALNHPNILTIYEIGETEDFRFMATEFVRGQTLNQYLQTEKFSLQKLLKLSIQIVSALTSAHEAGIVHRDIKPENIMVRNDGIVKVLDFGLAKLLETKNQRSKIKDQKSTAAGLIMGTPNYMSPEQARGKEIDFQTDIFSFGVVLYEMFSGKLPFSGETINDTIAAILTKEPPRLTEVPLELAEIVEKCLQKEKQNRYQTAKDLLNDLEDFSADLQVQDRLEKSFMPNRGEAKTQVLSPTTANKLEETVATQSIEAKPKSFTKYIVAGLTAILISVAGFFGYQTFFLSKQIESIAVLPFINESGNADVEYLSDGMTETLIKSLSNIPNLSVKARSSVFQYKGKEFNFKQISQDLKAQAILMGRFVQRGDQIILYLDLIDPLTNDVLWKEEYTRKQSDLVSLQNEIARDVSNNLKAKLTGEQKEKIGNSGTTNAEAYQTYLRGRYFATKGTADAPEQALKYFQETVALDPKFALAYAGIADAYTLLGTTMQSTMATNEAMPKAKAAAEKAVELDPNLSEAYTSLAWIKYRFDWDWVGAEKDFKKAIELNPSNAQAHQWYAELLNTLRREDESIAEVKKAHELEPFSILIYWNYAKILIDFGRYKEALPESKKIYEMDPSFRRHHRVLRIAYAGNGMIEQAFEMLLVERKAANDRPEWIELYKQTYQKEGYEAATRIQFETELKENKNLNSGTKALFYSILKDKENSLYWLEEAYKERNGAILYIKFSTYAFLKDEPRFKEVLRKMNLPE